MQKSDSIPPLQTQNSPQGKEKSPPAPQNQQKITHNQQIDEILNQANMQGPSNIGLLSRGLQLLSIKQLRQLLREYSLPTGGNKKMLVERLVMFLETFAPTQQNLLIQFSLKLKKLLSFESVKDSPEAPKTDSLPENLIESILKRSPSPLYEVTDEAPILGPIIVPPQFPSEYFEIPQGTNQNLVPVLQIVPVDQAVALKKVVFQMDGQYSTFNEPTFSAALPNLSAKNGILQILNVEPPTPVVLVVSMLKRIPVPQLIQYVLSKDPAPVIPGDAPVSGICPLTRKILVHPARSVKCQHPECFDLTGFLAYAYQYNNWICPICHKPLSIADLAIDVDYLSRVK